LEEVFLRVGNGIEEDEDSTKSAREEKPEEINGAIISEDYSISEQFETGFFNLFFTHLFAVFRKRFFTYRRSWRALLGDIFIPILIVLIGLGFTKVKFFSDSPPRQLEPSLFPLKQRIIVNSEIVKKSNNSAYDISPQSIIQ